MGKIKQSVFTDTRSKAQKEEDRREIRQALKRKSEIVWRNRKLEFADIEIYKAQDNNKKETERLWRDYRIQLRDYPAQEGFPNISRPLEPQAQE